MSSQLGKFGQDVGPKHYNTYHANVYRVPVFHV